MTSQSMQSPGANDVDSVAVADGAVSGTPDAGGHTHNSAPTRFVEVDGVRFAYRTDFVDLRPDYPILVG